MNPLEVDEIFVRNRITKLDSLARESASLAAGYIVTGDYSGAATECHRAHQKTLQAEELRMVIDSGTTRTGTQS